MSDFKELMKNSKINNEKLQKIIVENQEVQEIKKEVRTADKEKPTLKTIAWSIFLPKNSQKVCCKLK